jgi:hypothetical protein
VVHSEVGLVDVNGGGVLRGRRGPGQLWWHMDDFRNRLGSTGDEAVACSGARIKDNKWQQ